MPHSPTFFNTNLVGQQMSFGTRILTWQLTMLPKVPWTLKISPAAPNILFIPSWGKKRSLTRLSHIRTSPSWLVARQLAFFLFHLTCEAPAAKQNQGKKAVALNTFRTKELIQGSWIMSSGWIRTELFKLLWLHQLHNERENEAKKINELAHGNRIKVT